MPKYRETKIILKDTFHLMTMIKYNLEHGHGREMGFRKTIVPLVQNMLTKKKENDHKLSQRNPRDRRLLGDILPPLWLQLHKA